MNELALFAGGGGGLLGSILLGWKHVCYVEINPYCIEVIKARIKDGCLCDAPIWGDIKTFDGRTWAGCVDIITAGFPCQPFSVAGKQRGEQDDRNLWPETIRVIREVRPQFAFLENVPNLLVHEYARTIFGDLAESGYDCRWRIVSAADVGAPHLRKRLWILAESECPAAGMEKHRYSGQERGFTEASEPAVLRQENRKVGAEGAGTGRKDVANSHKAGRREQQHCLAAQEEHYSTMCASWWDDDPAEDATESQVGRVAHGIPDRISHEPLDPPGLQLHLRLGRVAHGIPDRISQLRAIGNAQVPGVARKAWELLNR